MSSKNNRQFLKEGTKQYFLTALDKWLNPIIQGLSVLILFLSLLIGFNLGVMQPAQAGGVTTITNTATVSFTINGVAQTKQSSVSLNKDTVIQRTPSTITFLRIDDKGTDTVIPPTAYNDSQTGGKHWQEVGSITLADGSTIDLPTPQPLVEADQYEISEPIVIEVKDLDQNTDDTTIQTIFITVLVPGTNDKEVLLLRETSPNSGIFRGVIATTKGTTQVQDGRLTLRAGDKITVNYRDAEDSTDTSATAAFVVADAKLALSKAADKTTATIGEQVRYTLNFTNTSDTPLSTLKIQDTLPVGLRYIKNSATLNKIAITGNKITSKGRSLSFSLSNMPRGEQWNIEYLVKITAGVPYGKVTNKAQLSSGALKSNIARAIITVKDDLMHTKNILTGRVYIGCETKNKPKVLRNARIFMETGRSILSDEEGFWHMEGVEAGTHTLKLDADSLPKGFEPLLCNDNTRRANDASSQFVNLQAGSLWQVDFHIKKTSASKQYLYIDKKDRLELDLSKINPRDYKEKHFSELNPANLSKERIAINPSKKFSKAYLASANSDFEILWPKHNYVPEIASTKIFVKSSPQHHVEVFLNGKKVSGLNYDGSDTNKARTAVIRRWNGVDIDIKNRDNTLLAILKDKSGKELARKTHNIHFSGKIASAEFLEKESVLIADGKTIPSIALLIKDEDGFPMRANTHGYFTLKDNRYSVKTLNETKGELNLNNSSGNGLYKFHIKADGIAMIELNPTSQSGELNLSIKLGHDKQKEINVWLKPKLRDWIMVGIVEGTVAYKKLSGNMQTLKDLNKEEKFIKNGRVAFFAKGRVKGKYLLTAAYDSHKKTHNVGELNDETNNHIDPDAWYNIYADNSHSQFDAASASKLYVKLERENFYALFGDFRTNLLVTDLAKYERTLNGLKSEFKGKRYSYNAFVSETSNQHHHQEIQGDGTSGLYHLSHDIVVNSETIKLETRDRFHSEKIVETRTLTRYQDYEIDYDAGTLFFKFPITGRDRGFNPQFIVVDYDSETNNNKSIVAGGRVAVKTINNKLEVGLSAVNIGKNKTKDNNLVALDATYKITPNTKVHAEIAQSKSQQGDYKSIYAQVLEIEKEMKRLKARAYYRKEEKGFGLGIEGSSNASQDGTQKIGAEVDYKINKSTKLKAEISQQENLNDTSNTNNSTQSTSKNKRQLAEATVTHKYKRAELRGGLRHSKEQFADKTITNNTALAGASITTKGGRVTYRADIEQNIESNSLAERSPNRKSVGVDIKIRNGMSIFAEHELTDNKSVKTQNTRVGVSQSLWKGAKAKSTYNRERTDQGQRDYATLGLSQRIQILKHLSADISVDHAKTIGGTQTRFNENEPTPQGVSTSTAALRDDYTAFSVGMGSHIKNWSLTGRFEVREGEINDKVNLRLGLIHKLKNSKQVSASFNRIKSENENGSYEKSTTLSLGTAWHPTHKDFVLFSRLDLVDKQSNVVNSTNNATDNSGKTHTQKIIHNVHYNRKINKKTQVSVHHGIKHIIDKNNQSKSTTTVDTGTVEVRYDIKKRWDVGARAGYLKDWNANTTKKVAGVSLGMRPTKNIWLEQGYNFEGFDDDDFDDSSYKHEGAYLSFRYKF